MNREEIKKILEQHEPKRKRTIVIVDFGNVEKWKIGLGWQVGIRELALLAKHFSTGSQFLRRFYYGSDYGENEKSINETEWSKYCNQTAKWSGFEVITKRVKYIRCPDNVSGFEKKCDLDVDMAIDLIQERENYDTIVLFSGDGDLVRALEYLSGEYAKQSIVVSARGHIGREVIDAKASGIISEILFADDFEYRLNMKRFMHR